MAKWKLMCNKAKFCVASLKLQCRPGKWIAQPAIRVRFWYCGCNKVQNLCPCRLTIELNFQCVLICGSGDGYGDGDGKTQAKTWPKDLETWRTHYTGRLSAVITVIFGKCSSHLTLPLSVCLSLSLHCGRPVAVAHQNPLIQYVSAKEELLAPAPLSLSLGCFLIFMS